MNYEDNVKEEFATIDLLLPSDTKTGRTDAFILAYTKLDKQIRKIFTYLVFQSDGLSDSSKIIGIIAADRGLYPEHFIKGFDALYRIPFAEIMADNYDEFENDRKRIKNYRDKMLHGQLTGESLDSKKLTEEVNLIRKWISLIAEKMSEKIGYDGVGQNSFRKSDPDKGFSNLFECKINNSDELNEFIQNIKQQVQQKRQKQKLNHSALEVQRFYLD